MSDGHVTVRGCQIGHLLKVSFSDRYQKQIWRVTLWIARYSTAIRKLIPAHMSMVPGDVETVAFWPQSQLGNVSAVSSGPCTHLLTCLVCARTGAVPPERNVPNSIWQYPRSEKPDSYG
jgi:hypothetical protein